MFNGVQTRRLGRSFQKFNRIFPEFVIVQADLWHGALSCKSRTPSMLVSAKRVVNEGINDDSSTSVYFVEFVRPHRRTIGLLLNQSCSPDHCATTAAPCFTVCTTHSSLNASPTRRRTKVTPGVPNICNKERNIKFRKKIYNFIKQFHILIILLNFTTASTCLTNLKVWLIWPCDIW